MLWSFRKLRHRFRRVLGARSRSNFRFPKIASGGFLWLPKTAWGSQTGLKIALGAEFGPNLAGFGARGPRMPEQAGVELVVFGGVLAFRHL